MGLGLKKFYVFLNLAPFYLFFFFELHEGKILVDILENCPPCVPRLV